MTYFPKNADNPDIPYISSAEKTKNPNNMHIFISVIQPTHLLHVITQISCTNN